MDSFSQIFRAVPALLVAYGVMATFGNMFELNITGDAMRMSGDNSYEMRMLTIVAMIRGFYEFFFFLGLAAVVAGLNKRNSVGAI